MIRVTKEPEERQNELINIAEALFMEKGYDLTTVEEIVRKAKIAKGTFYYYFKFKSDILQFYELKDVKPAHANDSIFSTWVTTFIEKGIYYFFWFFNL
ncbi:MAG: helix-turn-helix transcriptional regulator [Theionarchaea archaeon]|nr:MAG: hypothetical protein AYK19_01025 [Theionarchaea archaeon DG-70-1]MBU7029945.1 helix-turn-helix transcriptional regulator [Theionarchaea archaeon]